MKLKFIFLIFFCCALSFSQEPSQKSYARRVAIKKYLKSPIKTFNNWWNRNLNNYSKFRSNSKNLHGLKLVKSSGVSCSESCPRNFSILSLNKGTRVSEESSLSFLNRGNSFDKLMRKDYGFCWGHSGVTNILRHLAFFDPFNEFETFVGLKNSPAWREHVELIVKDILQNKKPNFIPFVENLNELSEVFETFMKEEVIKEWGSNAINLDSLLGVLDNERTYSKDYLLDLIQEIQIRLSLGETPELIFNIWDNYKWAHVILVKEVIQSPNSLLFTLVLDDNKISNDPYTMGDGSSKIVIDANSSSVEYSHGERFNAGSNRVGRIMITDKGYDRYNEMLPNLVSFCEKVTECQK